MKKYIGPGDVRTWLNATNSDVASGDVVVVGQQIGIATVAIADDASGEVAFQGEFTVPKVSGAVIKHGEAVMYDVSAAAFDDNLASPSTGDVSGAAVAAEDAGSGTTVIKIQLANRIGTVG